MRQKNLFLGKIVVAAFLSSAFLFCPNASYVVSIDVTDVPSTIDEDSAFTISVSISGAQKNTNYLRAVFSSADTSIQYFGLYSIDGSTWHSGAPSDTDKYMPIEIGNDGTWKSDSLQVKMDT